MALVPVGKRQIMVAQRFDSTMDPMQPMGFDNLDSEDAQMLTEPQEFENELKDQLNQNQQVEDEPSEPNIVKHISDFLVSMNYPPRRLQEFKSNFVEETGSAGGSRQVTITIPDQVYGKDSQIPMNKIKEFVKSVESQFSLYFENYKKSDQKIILNFISSDDKSRRDAEEAQAPGDILDEVYGHPSKSKQPGKAAESIRNIIKESKNDLVMSLLKVLEKK